jgi:hypothetical protein
MFLNENFLKLWEELSELNEAKADTEKLINFAGEELANKFLDLKSKLKAPENDLYYWIKKTPEELEAFLTKVEETKSNTQVKKEADQGAKLVCSSEHWNVYHITTFEASQKYGRDTKWCITGINNWGDKYWNEYIENGIQFYFLITKGDYDPRGKYSKIAIAVCEYPPSCEVFNQQDTRMTLDKIPYIEEIKIPGVDLENIYNAVICFDCGEELSNEIFYGPHDECYCKDCFDNNYYRCKNCGELHYAYIASFEDEHGDKFCLDCCDYDQQSKKKVQFMSKVTDLENFSYEISCENPYRNFTGLVDSKVGLHSRVLNAISAIPAAGVKSTKVEVISEATGELVYETTGVSNNTTKELMTAVEKYINSYN